MIIRDKKKKRIKIGSLSNKAFSILELIIVILAFVILVGVTVNMYTVGLTLWNEGYARSDIRADISLAMERITKALRQATSIDDITESSVTFTADLGSGSDSYRVYLYNSADAEPNPPYSENTYELRWAQSTVTYGSGANLATDIAQPTNTPFSQSGNVITMDFTLSRLDETIRMRSNVRPRNL